MEHWDWVIVGSGFGGSVSALRLAEKGYRVLVLEKGRRFSDADFPQTNWNLPRWLWAPRVGLRGPQKITLLRHVGILSGVGVGGGSLIYANTLPRPTSDFFQNGSWAGICDWESELAPHYDTAERMLGAAENPRLNYADKVLSEIGEGMGRGDHFRPTRVSVFFGEPGKTVPDPYFDGEGPERTGCIHCGACMTGCRHNAKNTLMKNYLYLAEKRGVQVTADTEVKAVRPRAEGGYVVETTRRTGWFGRERSAVSADRVILSGGVLGTVELLLRMKDDPNGLPELSELTGQLVRTNSESIIYMVSADTSRDMDRGVAIGSILHTDEHSHVEPVRYSRGSGFYRVMLLPFAQGATLLGRLAGMVGRVLRDPMLALRAWFNGDLGRYSTVLLYMRTLDSTLQFQRARGLGKLLFPIRTALPANQAAPTAFMPEAAEIAEQFGKKTRSFPMVAFLEVLTGAPTTAHILGGAAIGANRDAGVIGPDHQVHGYPGLYVCDGAAVSANPGVNPSLTITAMTERAMRAIPEK